MCVWEQGYLFAEKNTTEKRKVTSCVWKLGTRLCTHLCQSTEHPSHGLVVQPLRTVDDNDIHAHSLPQVLYCLCLPCACRALGAAPTIEVEGCSECHVAARWWGMRTGRMKTMTSVPKPDNAQWSMIFMNHNTLLHLHSSPSPLPFLPVCTMLIRHHINRKKSKLRHLTDQLVVLWPASQSSPSIRSHTQTGCWSDEWHNHLPPAGDIRWHNHVSHTHQAMWQSTKVFLIRIWVKWNLEMTAKINMVCW